MEPTLASSGSAGHRIVLDVGHMFGKKFKPWGAVKIADKIGKAATAANIALPVASAVIATVAEERARVKAERARARARAALVTEVADQADSIAREARSAVDERLKPAMCGAYAQIDRVADLIRATQTKRSDLQEGFLKIRQECDACLATLSSVADRRGP